MPSNLSIGLIIGASVGGAIAGFRQIRNSLTVLQNDTLATNEKFKLLGKNLGASIGLFASTATAISTSVVAAAEPAMKFESAMADVKKVVDFKTPDGFKNLSKDILELTRTLPMTAEELAAITASGGQLGVAEKDLKSFTTEIAKMSVAFDMSAEDSGDAMAKLANVYKIPIANIGALGDAINELSNSSPAKASDIVSTLGRIGGVAKQFGLTENAAAALSNSFISLGKAPEVAGTAINGMLTKLMTADKGGKAFQAALKQVGISAKQLKENIAKDGEGALIDFMKRIQKMPKAQQMGILVDLFGLEYADDVAVLAGNVNVLEDSLKTLQTTDANGKPTYLGSMQKEFEARAATTENSLKLLKNNFTEVGITLGSALLPYINQFVQAIMPVVHSIADWISQNQEWVQMGLKVVGILAAGILGFSALNAVVSLGSMAWLGITTSFTKVFSTFSKVIGLIRFSAPFVLTLGKILAGHLVRGLTLAARAVMWLGRAMLMNPIGLAVTAIAAGAYLIYTYWEPIKAFFGQLWDWVSQKFSAAWAVIQSAWSGVGDWVANAWGGITDFFSNLWQQVTTAFSGGIGNIGAQILNWSPLGLFYQCFAGVMNWFGVELPSTFTGFGANLIDGLVNGIKETWEKAKEGIIGLGRSIKGWFTGEMEIHSPSRVFKGYGENITAGLAIGVSNSIVTAQKAMGKLGDKVKEAAPSAVTMAVDIAGKVATLPKIGNVASKQAVVPTPKFAKTAKPALQPKAKGKTARAHLQKTAKSHPLAGAKAHSLANYQPLKRDETPAASPNIVVHFSPNITVNGEQGNTLGLREQVLQALQNMPQELERLLQRVMEDKQRRAY